MRADPKYAATATAASDPLYAVSKEEQDDVVTPLPRLSDISLAAWPHGRLSVQSTAAWPTGEDQGMAHLVDETRRWLTRLSIYLTYKATDVARIRASNTRPPALSLSAFIEPHVILATRSDRQTTARPLHIDSRRWPAPSPLTWARRFLLA